MSEKELKVGDKAPLFKLESYNAGMIDLSKVISSQKTVLIFGRYFGCPICQLDLNTLIQRSSEIEKKGGKILYVIQSGQNAAKEFIDKKKIKFPVIFSSKDALYKDYGLGMMTVETAKEVRTKVKEAFKAGFQHGDYEGYEQQQPGQFVIDKDGKIIHAKKSWLDLDAILKVL
jgi:peroxiredoxin